MTDSPAVTAAVEKSLKNTWMKDYPERPEYRSLSDGDLAGLKRGFPKYTNEMTPEQMAISAAVYREQMRRYHAAKISETDELASAYGEFEKSGKWPDGSPFPQAGTAVTNVLPGIFGLPQVVEGVVKKKKDGTYVVAVTSRNVGGAKTTRLTKGWQPKAPRLSR